MFIRGLDTSPTRVTVTVGPAILARTRAARVTVDIGHVSPHVTLGTMTVFWTGQLQFIQRYVCENSEMLHHRENKTKCLKSRNKMDLL